VNTIHPFPGTLLAVVRGVAVAVGATISAFAFLPGDYVAPAAVALAFVVALVTADA
jgi:hypothetical protein